MFHNRPVSGEQVQETAGFPEKILSAAGQADRVPLEVKVVEAGQVAAHRAQAGRPGLLAGRYFGQIDRPLLQPLGQPRVEERIPT
jgi:hypothetical protein